MNIITYPDKRLKTPAEHVEEINDELNDLIDNMTKLMLDNNGLGLAAPQVGESKRLFVYTMNDTPHVLINPEIVGAGGVSMDKESCLSVLGLAATVPRRTEVIVTGVDQLGREQEFNADGMLARVLQHEMDHLEGILFLNRISKLKRDMYDSKLRKAMRNAIRAGMGGP